MRVESPKAMLFDIGGTLDGDGVHWLDRFLALYRALQVPRSEEFLKEAFYWADEQLMRCPDISQLTWEPLLRRHVEYQLGHLGLPKESFREALAKGFVQPTAILLRQHRKMLAGLHSGLRFGVVSNFYGNLAAVCQEFGFTPLLEVIVDSAVVHLYKPDPRIFTYALSQLRLAAEEVWYVGDSWDRDMVPAKQVGLRTVWLTKNGTEPPGDPAAADFMIRSLQELPGLLASRGQTPARGLTPLANLRRRTT